MGDLEEKLAQELKACIWKKGERFEIIEEERGRIIPVADGEFRTVMVIESKQGSIRANHYHRTDSHIMYILSGKTRYVEVMGENGVEIGRELVLGPGESVLTAPMVPPAMEFLEDTIMIVCARNARDTVSYLTDLVRVKIL